MDCDRNVVLTKISVCICVAAYFNPFYALSVFFEQILSLDQLPLVYAISSLYKYYICGPPTCIDSNFYIPVENKMSMFKGKKPRSYSK